ncbi:hypothetical protein INQ41_01380 [Lysobacter ciconiae]|uniref:Energy transducer TonB n=1 Tax=Novilysobacter ciconiae TaxID=2781022 RepID=A0A7S6ZSE2_9GAMM|nr:hypothetical protein [Lysobacter ciconiae]QOW19758.1 hypothetical protein INQ41_01380 [Lysobacter ciconiae]
MNRVLILLASATLALAGCATAPVTDPTALQISDGEVENYWTPTAELVSTKLDLSALQGRSGQMREMAHTVEVTYIIGSDGKIHDSRVLSTIPASASGQWALAGLSAASYEPAPGNTARLPVRLTHTITLGAPPAAN